MCILGLAAFHTTELGRNKFFKVARVSFLQPFVLHTNSPTEPFTILEPANRGIDELYEYQKRHSTDGKAKKNVKISVGRVEGNKTFFPTYILYEPIPNVVWRRRKTFPSRYG